MLLCSVFFPPQCPQIEDRGIERGGGGERERERERAVLAKLLIVHIKNKATDMLNKSEPLGAYPPEGFM